MYMHDRLSSRFVTEVIPGIPAFAAATAATASPLVRQTDVLTVLPGRCPKPNWHGGWPTPTVPSS